MSNVSVQLPSQLDGSDLCAVVQQFINACSSGMPATVTIDFARLRFIKPAGVTFLSNFIDWLYHRGVKVLLLNHLSSTDALRFLDDSLFFERFLGARISPSASPRSTTKPLRSVAHDEVHAWLRGELIPWLSYKLRVPEASLHGFKVCVSEIFNNISDHSTQTIGSIFVQHFPKLDRVSIAVADFGIGIPEAVRKVRADLQNDHEAIVEAVQAGFTTRSTPGNRGDGLDYLLQTVVQGNRGDVRIYSLTGHVLFSPDGTGVGVRRLPNPGFCPGTTIDISLRTDTIVAFEDEPEEFEW